MSMRSEISACSKPSSQIHPDSLNCKFIRKVEGAEDQK